MRASMLLFCLLANPCFGWHDPHITISRAAIDSLPLILRQMLAGEGVNIAELYSFYPDRYRNAAPMERAFMKRYCELPGGKQIHNVTWDKTFDVETVQYLFEGMVESLRAGDASALARYAGTLAHLSEDSLSPAHAMDLRLLQELVPPPESARKLYVHAPMEISCPNFTLGERSPRRLGATIPEAAKATVDSTYARIRKIRGTLTELIQAVYRDDTAVMDKLRLVAAQSAAELYADALYSVLSIAHDQGIAPPPSATPASASSDVEIETSENNGSTARRAAINLAYGLQQAVRALGIEKRVQRTQLGHVRVRVPRTDAACVGILGDWPPHSGSQVTQVCLDASATIISVQTILDGAAAGPQALPFGEFIRTVDHRGDPLFELSAGPSVVAVMNHEKATATLKPLRGSFADGLLLELAGRNPLLIRVTIRDGAFPRVSVSDVQ